MDLSYVLALAFSFAVVPPAHFFLLSTPATLSARALALAFCVTSCHIEIILFPYPHLNFINYISL